MLMIGFISVFTRESIIVTSKTFFAKVKVSGLSKYKQ